MNTIRTSISSSRSSQKSFRVVVKSRLTHQIVSQNDDKFNINRTKLKKQIDDQFIEQAKNNLKKYVRTMKSNSMMGSYNEQKNIMTNRKSTNFMKLTNRYKTNPQNDQDCQSVQSQTIAKNTKIKKFTDMNLNNLLNQSKIKKSKNKHLRTQTLINQYKHENSTILIKEENQINSIKNDTIDNFQEYLQNEETSTQRYRLLELENKIENILAQKLKHLSQQASITSSQNINSYKLMQKQIDRVLQQIKQIKLKESASPSFYQNNQNQVQINKNIQMIERKVNILERLIAEKLFQADNLRNQYLQKLKKQKANLNNVRSKSTSFYRQANNNSLNPLNFKNKKHIKQRLNTLSTTKQSYQKPLKSYYVNSKRQNFYNNMKLNQPLPRSSYNCEYLVYGPLPKILNSSYEKIKDHSLFNTVESQQQKNHLSKSIYKQEFSQKVDNEPVNFRELDCYKDKFKSIKVNFGRDKDDRKIVNIKRNSSTLKDYYNDHLKEGNKKQQKNNPELEDSKSLFFDTQKKLQQLSNLHQTEHKLSNLEQQNLHKMNLFQDRIKAEIKHKNINNLKYEFNKKFIKSRQEILKSVKQNSS